MKYRLDISIDLTGKLGVAEYDQKLRSTHERTMQEIDDMIVEKILPDLPGLMADASVELKRMAVPRPRQADEPSTFRKTTG